MDLYSNLKKEENSRIMSTHSANSNLKITYYPEYNQAELKKLSRTAAKILGLTVIDLHRELFVHLV